MNTYIQSILEIENKEQQEKKVQTTVYSLISKYSKSSDNIYLQYIKEVATYFKAQKINFSYKSELLLKTASLLGEKDFIEWLLKESNYKKQPNVLIEDSGPLRYAVINEKYNVVEFLLADKDIPKSNVNAVYGTLFECVIEKNNAKIIKLFLADANIDIKIEHIQEIYKLDTHETEEILEFVSENKVKNQFFEIMVQYKSKLQNEIYDLLTKKYFFITPKVIEILKYSPEYNQIIEKKDLMIKLEEKYPNKNNHSALIKPRKI